MVLYARCCQFVLPKEVTVTVINRNWEGMADPFPLPYGARVSLPAGTIIEVAVTRSELDFVVVRGEGVPRRLFFTLTYDEADAIFDPEFPARLAKRHANRERVLKDLENQRHTHEA